jgi:hypothetical protein
VRSKVEAIRKRLSRLDPLGNLCASCVASPDVVEVEVIGGRPTPPVPPARPCDAPATCPGRVREIVYLHWVPDPDGDDDLDDGPELEPLPGDGLEADPVAELAAA